ncbi:hypothetical protein P9112_000863 [Eukaryota sp. TZLM1-RC]
MTSPHRQISDPNFKSDHALVSKAVITVYHHYNPLSIDFSISPHDYFLKYGAHLVKDEVLHDENSYHVVFDNPFNALECFKDHLSFGAHFRPSVVPRDSFTSNTITITGIDPSSTSINDAFLSITRLCKIITRDVEVESDTSDPSYPIFKAVFADVKDSYLFFACFHNLNLDNQKLALTPHKPRVRKSSTGTIPKMKKLSKELEEDEEKIVDAKRIFQITPVEQAFYDSLQDDMHAVESREGLHPGDPRMVNYEALKDQFKQSFHNYFFAPIEEDRFGTRWAYFCVLNRDNLKPLDYLDELLVLIDFKCHHSNYLLDSMYLVVYQVLYYYIQIVSKDLESRISRVFLEGKGEKPIESYKKHRFFRYLFFGFVLRFERSDYEIKRELKGFPRSSILVSLLDSSPIPSYGDASPRVLAKLEVEDFLNSSILDVDPGYVDQLMTAIREFDEGKEVSVAEIYGLAGKR